MKPNRPLIVICSIVALLLLIPLIAMQFTHEVNWTLSDFLVAGLLLLGTGLLVNFILNKAKTTKNKVILVAAILVLLVLTWIELAVGIFGTPFAGN